MTEEELLFFVKLEEQMGVCVAGLLNSDPAAALQPLTSAVSACEARPELALSGGYLPRLEQYLRAYQVQADPDLARSHLDWSRMSAAKSSAELREACGAAVRGHNAAAAKALAKGDVDLALESLEHAILLYEGTTLQTRTDPQCHLLAQLTEICRLLCYRQRPHKVNDALKLI
jgi:hypothetical protein